MLVACDKHGEQPPACVCPHLGDGAPGAVVGGDLLTATALCTTCDAGIGHVWSKLGPDDVDVVCALCFGELVAASQDVSSLPTGQPLFAKACTEMIERNRLFLAAIDHDAHAGWTLDGAALAFVDATGAPRIRCDVDPLGTLTGRGWRPAWSDPAHPGGVRARAGVARALGQRLHLAVLGLPEIPAANLDAAWHLAQLGGWLQGAQATYQVPVEGGQAFVAVARWERVKS